MEVSFVGPGLLDVAGTLSRFRLSGEDPAHRLSDSVLCCPSVPPPAIRSSAAWTLFKSLSNDEVITRLTAMRGVGRWSAEWFLGRGLGRGDVRPAGGGGA